MVLNVFLINLNILLETEQVLNLRLGTLVLVQAELTVSKSLKRFTRSIVTSFVEAFHRFQQSTILLRIRREFYHQSLLHTNSVEQYVLYVKDYFKKEDSRNSSVA